MSTSIGPIEPITDEAFVADWERIHSFAFSAGVSRLELEERKQAEYRGFYRDVHRAYEKAQRRIATRLRENAGNAAISEGERLHRQLVLRKLADGIAYTMALGQTHLIRRLCTNETPTDLPFEKLPEYLNAAERLNGESRQTFALVADLTTFVHLADLLRIDLRTRPHRLTTIELKTGKVNEQLLGILDGVTPSAESIAALKNRADIPSSGLKQAQRMLRQRLRVNQVSQLLTTDSGFDPGVGMPMRLSQDTITTSEYDRALNGALDLASEKGIAYVSIDGCVHLGVHYQETVADWRIATAAAKEGLTKATQEDATQRRSGIQSLRLSSDDGSLSFHTDPYGQGLLAPAVRPFSLWRIKAIHRAALMTGRARISSLVDVVGLAGQYAKFGLTLRLTSRREAARYASEVGGSRLLLLQNHALTHDSPQGPAVLMKGTFSRFLYELICPRSYIAGVASARYPDQALLPAG